ncbi:MAG: DNA-3-methyladenine glycosylase [Fodinibius sp.]|nr:DNA-3-methyladenine glycosylase [Fodinibius sp.]
MMRNVKLPPSFYRRDNVVTIARQLVGKVFCTRFDHTLTSGIITETEAYCGRGDKACHAHGGSRTERTETMYKAGGIAYIYLCYGIHHLFNIVTNIDERADAVLVRAVKPLEGQDLMLRRRESQQVTASLTAGPGRLTEALGISRDYDGASLQGDDMWIEDRGIFFSEDELQATQRVGIDYAGEDAQLPWRFYPTDSKWVSQK